MQRARKGGSGDRDERERGTDRTERRREPEHGQNSGDDPKPNIFSGNCVELGIAAILIRRRTNVQQLTCKIDLSNYFYYLFFSFVLLELKPFVLKGKVLGEKVLKSAKNAKKCEKL